MKIIAAVHDGTDYAFALEVTSNPFSVIGLGSALYARAYKIDRQPGEKKFMPGVLKYKTVKEFMQHWVIFGSMRHDIPVPFLKKSYMLGDVIAKALSLIGVFPTNDCGCPDRHEWFNFLLAFVPMGDE